MRIPIRLIARWLLLPLLASALAGCTTLPYRGVQSDFERAVAEDNQRTQSPFVDWYRQVADTLTPAYIGKLDPKLRPNAWMLRAVSAWRSDDLAGARTAASKGLKEPGLVEGSRDDVILRMIPAMVVDSELRANYRSDKAAVPVATYTERYGRSFKVAVDELAAARARFNERTPESTVHYWNYHRWRVLQNWSLVIAHLSPATAVDERIAANQSATDALGGKDLSTAAKEAAAAIPADHPLRGLIDAESRLP